MKRKNEKLTVLEKRYLETKEDYDQVKSKYETLKKILGQNEMTSRVFSLTNPFPQSKNPKITNLEENKQDSQNKMAVFNMPSTKNIVKTIKGGQGHGKISEIFNTFFNYRKKNLI